MVGGLLHTRPLPLSQAAAEFAPARPSLRWHACVCVHVCMRAHKCVCAFVCLCVHTRVRACFGECVRVHACACACLCVFVRVCACVFVRACTRVFVCVRSCVRVAHVGMRAFVPALATTETPPAGTPT